jgi:hypothetical protein
VELIIEGDASMHVEGTVTIELPSYMKTLPSDELEQVRTATNRAQLALAAGRHPQTREIVVVTGVGEIISIDTVQFMIPSGQAWPTNGGLELHIELDDFESLDVDTEWALRVGQQIINLGTLADPKGARVSYIDE